MEDKVRYFATETIFTRVEFSLGIVLGEKMKDDEHTTVLCLPYEWSKIKISKLILTRHTIFEKRV